MSVEEFGNAEIIAEEKADRKEMDDKPEVNVEDVPIRETENAVSPISGAQNDYLKDHDNNVNSSTSAECGEQEELKESSQNKPKPEEISEKMEGDVQTMETPEAEKNIEKNSPTKSPKKEKALEAGDDDDEDEEEELQPGLFDRSPIMEGKRQRSSVQRLAIAEPSSAKRSAYGGGKGVTLGSIDFVVDQLNKHRAEELKPMCRLLFGTVGKATTIKKEIRSFSGFDFEEKSDTFQKRMNSANKMSTKDLKEIIHILGIPMNKATTKDAYVSILMPFLLKPEDYHRKVPQSRKRKSTASAKGANPSKRQKKHTSPKKSKPSASSKETVDSDSDESSDGKDGIGKDDEEKSNASASNQSDDENKDVDSDSDDSNEKGKKVTKDKKKSDKDLIANIKKMLDEFDLTQVTMKQMCLAVIEKHPKEGLEDRRQWLKDTIKKLLGSS